MMAISAGTFQACQNRGSRLNSASTPLATERAAVRTKLTISGGTGDEAGIGADQHRGDAITTAAGGKQLDDLDVAETNDDDGERRCQRQIDGQMVVTAKRDEGFFRSVVCR